MIVVAWHFVWAFAPDQLGSVAGRSSPGLIGSPAIAAIDGPAAVALFFVLSGFVVPLGFFRDGRRRVAVQAVAKRWLRLAVPAASAALLSYLLFRLGLFHYREAAGVTHSEWLASYGGSDPSGTLVPSLAGALEEGLVGAFLRDYDTYAPVLWTMHQELLGSLVSLAMALIICRSGSLLCGLGLIGGSALALMTDPWLVPFIVGTGLAVLSWRHPSNLHWAVAVASICLGLFLFGYLEPTGSYAGFQVVQDSTGYRDDRILVHTLAGALIIIGLIGNDAAGRALRIRPLVALGRLSFPIYLFHFPLLCSLACGLFITFQRAATYQVSLALVVIIYLPVVLVSGLLFGRVDDAWTVFVNRLSNILLIRVTRSVAQQKKFKLDYCDR